MPRVYSTTRSNRGKARKCGRCGEDILPGEKYFSWSFRYSGTFYRCFRHYPRQSELTQSKMAQVYGAIEACEDALPGCSTVEEVNEAVQAVHEDVQAVVDEYREAAEAMGAAGAENEERADNLEGWAEQLDGWEADVPEEDEFDEDKVRAQAERQYVYEDLPPHAQEAYDGPDDLPTDPIDLHKIMQAFDMDEGERFQEFVDAKVEAAREEHGEAEDPVEAAREQAQEVLNECPA